MSKLIEAAKEALKVARCDHVFVATRKQPSDTRYQRQYCPLCKATFLSPKSGPRGLLRVIAKASSEAGVTAQSDVTGSGEVNQ